MGVITRTVTRFKLKLKCISKYFQLQVECTLPFILFGKTWHEAVFFSRGNDYFMGMLPLQILVLKISQNLQVWNICSLYSSPFFKSINIQMPNTHIYCIWWEPEGQSIVDEGHMSLGLLYPDCVSDVSTDSLVLTPFLTSLCKTLSLPANQYQRYFWQIFWLIW